MGKVVTCLIEKNPLFREGLKSLLQQSSFDPALEFSSLESLANIKEGARYKLAIVGTERGHNDCVVRAVKELKEKMTDVLVVVLSDVADKDSIAASFSAGADGFLLRDISPKALIASLNLIMTGEKVFPTSMASIIALGWDTWLAHDNPANAANSEFSTREKDIIHCLAEGQSNKLIAKNLSITEATVKVHLKTILRKLGFSNRTQVAIWAINNGVPVAAAAGGHH